jgi:hypothetical protein
MKNTSKKSLFVGARKMVIIAIATLFITLLSTNTTHYKYLIDEHVNCIDVFPISGTYDWYSNNEDKTHDRVYVRDGKIVGHEVIDL